MVSQRSERQVTFTAYGDRRYEIKVWHTELNKIQIIRGDDESIVDQKVEAKMRQWDEMWAKRQARERKARDKEREAKDKERKAKDKEEKLSLAKDRTSEALLELEALDKILKHTLAIDDTIDWESLKNKDSFPEPNPSPILPQEPKKPTIPEKPKESKNPAPPDPEDIKYQPKYGLLDLSKKKA